MTTNTASVSVPTDSVPVDRAVGSIFGLAFGDATGDPTEFRKYDSIKGRVTVPDKLRITDDTQMSLAVWAALDEWDGRSLGTLRLELVANFLAWYHDEDNNRAPGNACMAACRQLDRVGMGGWLAATGPTSAGCGSVMRAPWVGLHPKLSDELVESVAALQAALTHAPAENAYVSAAAAALTRALARGEVTPGGCAAWLQAWFDARVGVLEYDAAALGDVWRVAKDTLYGQAEARRYVDRDEYVDEGLAHVQWVASTASALAAKLADDPWSFDPCTVGGEGWRCREALALAVGIVDGFADWPGDPNYVLIRAAETNGDSDSIAAIAGALWGAAHGDVWSRELRLRLESRYRNELSAVAAQLKG